MDRSSTDPSVDPRGINPDQPRHLANGVTRRVLAAAELAQAEPDLVAAAELQDDHRGEPATPAGETALAVQMFGNRLIPEPLVGQLADPRGDPLLDLQVTPRGHRQAHARLAHQTATPNDPN